MFRFLCFFLLNVTLCFTLRFLHVFHVQYLDKFSYLAVSLFSFLTCSSLTTPTFQSCWFASYFPSFKLTTYLPSFLLYYENVIRLSSGNISFAATNELNLVCACNSCVRVCVSTFKSNMKCNNSHHIKLLVSKRQTYQRIKDTVYTQFSTSSRTCQHSRWHTTHVCIQ